MLSLNNYDLCKPIEYIMSSVTKYECLLFYLSPTLLKQRRKNNDLAGANKFSAF